MWESAGNVVLSFSLLVAAGCWSRLYGEWSHPGGVWLFCWGVFLTAACLAGLGDPEFTITLAAVAWLVGAAFAFAAGGAVAWGVFRRPPRPGPAARRNEPPRRQPDSGDLPRTLYACLVAAAAAVVLAWRASGRPLSALLELDALVAVANEYAVNRYHFYENAPRAARLLQIGAYAGALLGGGWYAQARGWKRRAACLAPGALGVLYSAIVTTRATACWTALLWGGAYVADAARRRKTSAGFVTWRRAAAASAGLALGVLFFAGVRDYRGRGELPDAESLRLQLSQFRSQLLGSAVCFSHWFGSERESQGVPGEKTFYGVLGPLGIGERRMGLYDERISFADGSESNVFTIHRGLIEDFGLAGALACLSAMGGGVGLAYEQLRQGRRWAVPVVAAAYTTAVWGVVASPWLYSTLVASVGIACVAIGGRRSRRAPSSRRLARPALRRRWTPAPGGSRLAGGWRLPRRAATRCASTPSGRPRRTGLDQPERLW